MEISNHVSNGLVRVEIDSGDGWKEWVMKAFATDTRIGLTFIENKYLHLL